MKATPDQDSLATWMHRIDSVGPGSLLVAIESRLGSGISRHVSPEDILQEALLSLCRTADRLEWKGHAAFRSWLLTVIDHRIADAARMNKPGTVTHSDSHAPPCFLDAVRQSTTPSRIAAYHEEAGAIRAALSGLPDELRGIVRARIIEQRTLAEIAASEGLTIGVVRHRFRTGAELYAIRLRRELAWSDGAGTR
ncbi:MAG: sigma-70 family RNA polymerase sigma factor [Phycisphaerales bacterium]|nr:sigma-70 family RNA polymerase sigma factor [Phycisphaerales bacterium]